MQQQDQITADQAAAAEQELKRRELNGNLRRGELALRICISARADFLALERIIKQGIEMVALGDGFTWLSENIEHDIALAMEAWELARAKIMSAEYDLVVLSSLDAGEHRFRIRTISATAGSSEWLDIGTIMVRD